MRNFLSKAQCRTKPLRERGHLYFFIIPLSFLAIMLILSQNGLFALRTTELTTTYFSQLLGHHPGEPGSALFIHDNYLYMGFQQELVIFDATSETNPTIVASLFFQEHIYEIVVVNDLAYILTSKGLHILDVTNPETAVKIGSITIDDIDLSSMKIVDQTAYILGYEGNGLYIVDVSNPYAPIQSGFYATSNRRAIISSQDQPLFLLNNAYDTLQAFSLADPFQPQPTISYSTPEDTYIKSAVLANGHLYLLTETLGNCLGGCSAGHYLRILDPDTLVELTSIASPPASQMKITNDYIYFLQQDDGPADTLYVWELTTPLTAQEVGSQPIEGTVLNMVVDAKNVYVSIESFGLQRINIIDPTMPQPAGDYQTYNLKEIALGNDMTTLFALDANDQFRILDLANPEQPKQLYSQSFQQFPYNNRTLALALADELVYLLWFDDSSSRYTLDIIDVTIPTNPIYMSRYPLQEPTSVDDFSRAQLQVIGDKVHLVIQAPLDGGYTIVDVANLAMPQQQDIWASGNLLDDFVILGDRAILSTRNGLQLLNIADPTQFVDLGMQLTDRNFTVGPIEYQNILYFGEWPENESTQLSVFDASKPVDIIAVNQQDIEGVPTGMWVAADQLYIIISSIDDPIQENGGTYLYMLDNPSEPDFAAWLFNVEWSPTTIDPNNAIFAASRYSGLNIVRLLPTVSEQYLPVITHSSQ